ncbi:hypothetical protein RclHR1_11990006 [Rhizophagus clarus]|uniref:L domain-like protein n=1 Tax=Rhizophagus clarus TaxID=94130 RepID=A0A2Z6QYR2_9GLOM|nr:hypothetical protein RclHR1_11990006 [Rhizophagus clarus]
MHVLSKLWSFRSEPPRLPKRDYMLVEDTSMYPISCEDEDSSEVFAGKTDSCDQENLLSDTDTAGAKNLAGYKKAESSFSNNEQPATIIVEKEISKDTSFVNSNNENNFGGNILELYDAITPSIKRGFYGLEDIMVRRQHVSVKKVADKAVQVGNGLIKSHDFAGQTSFVIEEKRNADVNLDEYLKSSSGESYSEDASEDIIGEHNDNSETIENENKSIQVEESDKDIESLSNSDMSIDYGQESYQGNEIFIENLINEKDYQNQILPIESCDKINPGLLLNENPMTTSAEVKQEVLMEDNDKFLSVARQNEKNTDGLKLEQESPIFQIMNETAQTITTTQVKEKKKVHIISPDITSNEELGTIPAGHKESSEQKICYTPVNQKIKTLSTSVMDSERSICTPGTTNSNYSFRVTHDTLTKLISGMESNQSHWKEMSKIDLNTGSIESLNHLNELLPKLKELNLNNNLLRYLTGTPASLTTLQVRGNRLTSLTSFAHLPNLEYLDISQNRIETLTDLHRLEHLREVFADENLITCCYSVLRIPGLVKLSLKKNKLKSVDFESFDLSRLELLDLSENKIELIENVERLLALKLLNLDHNFLRSFSATTNMPQLTCLRVCYNKLSELDVSPFPSLRLLWVDENRLKTIKCFETLAFLETFSARDQKGGQMYLSLKHLRDFKHVYLSGNPIKTLEPIIDFYKLEYLELAAAQIKELPHKLHHVCPSIIVLILSYNELQDLRPLRRMKRLRRLFLESNRISDYMAFSEVLKTLPKLKCLDIRNNPFSSNFYPTIPAIASSLVHQNSYAMHRDPEEETEWVRLDGDFKQNLEDQWFVKRCFYRYDVFRRCPNIEWLDGSSIDPKEKELGSNLLNMDTAKILKSA